MFYSHCINAICWIKSSRSIGHLGVNRFLVYRVPLIRCLECYKLSLAIVSQPLETNDILIFSVLSIDHGRYRTEVIDIFQDWNALN